MERLLNKLGNLLLLIKKKRPLVHSITNTVAANPSANVLLSIGALPIMSSDVHEVSDVVQRSQALVLNTGTLSQDRIDSMLAAGKAAEMKGIPVVFDPVGAGASRARGKGIFRLLEEIKVDIIRGNLSEVAFLVGEQVEIRGVEALDEGYSEAEKRELVLKVAERFSCTACITGQRDFISDGENVFVVDNGHPLMSRVTAMGCMLSAVIGAFASVTDNYLDAALGAVVSYGVAGELAAEASRGPGTFFPAMYDSLYMLESNDIVLRGKIKRLK
ncbi:MAG: hydroxyethylthiazole kinase [Clostridia bacterium]|nr:hydroxyethylthiazole kinase [Clostridia bacterium]